MGYKTEAYDKIKLKCKVCVSEWQLSKAVGERLVAGMLLEAVRSVEVKDYNLRVVRGWV